MLLLVLMMPCDSYLEIFLEHYHDYVCNVSKIVFHYVIWTHTIVIRIFLISIT